MLNLLAAGWYLTPYATVHDLTEAARRGDAGVLSKHVDWATVRLNASYRIKSCTADKAMAPAAGTNGATIRGLLGAAMNAFIPGLVNHLVSLESITALVKVSPAGTGPSVATQGAPGPTFSDIFDMVVWKASDRIELWVKNGAQGSAVPRLEVTRQGLSWQATQVMFDCPRWP